jgi:hypothetical protein
LWKNFSEIILSDSLKHMEIYESCSDIVVSVFMGGGWEYLGGAWRGWRALENF